MAEFILGMGSLLGEPAPAIFRGEQPEDAYEIPEGDRDAWIAAQVASYASGQSDVPLFGSQMPPEQLRQIVGPQAYNLILDSIFLGEELPPFLIQELERLGIEL